MRILFFDCETTGLPKNWKSPMSDLENWPRVIELGWMVTDEQGKELRRHKYLIKPDGWVIPEEKFWIDNGFSTEQNEILGMSMRYAASIFMEDLQSSDVLVSHNMSYDYNVVGAEKLRLGMAFKEIKKVCTKEAGTNVCQIPGSYGSFKWPKLEELHTHLFQKSFDGAHDALIDVIACKDCFFELVKRNVIQLS